MNEDVIKFLKESNNIENVWDDDSLAQAIYAWNYVIKEDKLSVGSVLKSHKILMLNQNISPDEKGYFRKRPVWIGGHEAKSWWAIDTLINNWLNQVNINNTEEGIQNDHVLFEAIHGFVDGNGRLGRILMNWARIKNNYPILIIWAKNKENYYKWFQ